MNRVKKFVKEHRDEFIFLGGMVVATGYMTVVGRKAVNGMQIHGGGMAIMDDQEYFLIRHKNGRVSKLKYNK